MGSMKLLFASITLVAFTNFSYAQEKSAEEKAAAQTEQMATSLGLSAEQKEKVAELNLGVAQKNEAVRQNPNMTADQRTEAIKGNNEGRNNVLRTILTPEQYTQYEQQQAAKKANMGQKKSIPQKKRKVQMQQAPVKQ